MESIELMFAALLGISLIVFLIHYISKRASTSLANADDRTLKIGGEVIRCVFKWVAIIFLFYIGSNFIASWPPHWLERMQQRKMVLERVQEAGGWQVIKADCEDVVAAGATNGFRWLRGWKDNPPLPNSLTALKPRIVDLQFEKDGMQSVLIQIFGGHSTGGRGRDFYILKVVCPLPVNVRPPFKADPDAKVKYGDRKMFDGIYEVTRNS